MEGYPHLMDSFMLRFFTSAGIVVFSFLLASFLKGKVLSLRSIAEPQRAGVLNLLAHTVYISVNVLGVLTALGVLGVNISALVAGLGLTGFAVGFALKDIISNLLAGILIILYSPFRIGDRIRVGSYEGKVVEINLRYTVIENGEGKVLIPNSTMFTNIIAVRKE
jgi:small-conductance mechanosensitive channel